ncbi:aryl hydrocarbon receptor-like [Polymixia lowei]
MLGNVALYAGKKRKKPVQKIPKPPPPDGAKSNPSKRHRDRLNGELDKLTGLLPFSEDIRTRLDKLSVLRLSVGYLKVKSFFNATMKKGPDSSSWPGQRRGVLGGTAPSSLAPTSMSSSSMVTSIDGVTFSEGDLLLQVLNGFVLVVTGEGYIFYTSSTIQNYLGFHQSDVVHQSIFDLIHADDRPLFRRQLHFAFNPNPGQMDSTLDSHSEQSGGVVTYDPQVIPPENSSFLERSFCCRFRCLLDNSSGFLALNFRGRLKFLHGQNKVPDDGNVSHPQLALFTIATPLQPPSILEIRTKTLIFQTKHKLDFTPVGIDTRGKLVLGYNEIELCMKGSGYQFIHAADMMYCADNHIRMIKTGESGFSAFRLLTKAGIWVWVQANARLVFKAGKPDFIVARQRALTNEEGEEQLRLRRLQLPFNFATGEAVLYNVAPTLDVPDPCSAPKQCKLDELSVNPDSLLGCMLRQDQAIYCQHGDTNALSSLNDAAFKDTHALVSVPGDIWQHPTAKPCPTGLVKAEGMVQDMMETLQQILGDSTLSAGLDVEPGELKDWENSLLKMSGSGTCEITEDLDEILSNDILSYVEEQLLKEGELKVPAQLNNIPACLSSLDLQNTFLGAEHNFGWTMEPENQLVPNRGEMVAEKQTPVPGLMNLAQVGPPQMGSTGLNGPVLQQISSQNTFAPSVGVHSDFNTTDSLGAPVNFNPSLVDSCAQTQNQLRSLQVTPKENGLGPCTFRQTSDNHLHSSQITQPIQSHLHPRLHNMVISLQDQSTARQLNPMVPCQNNQWSSSNPSSNPTSSFVEAYAQNISNQPSFNVDPSLFSSSQGHFALQTQSSENQCQSWSLQQQQQHQPLPTLTSNGQQQINQTLAFQGNTLPGVSLPMCENTRPTFRPSKTSNMAFPVPQEVQAPVPSSSCMFGGAAPTMPVNRLHLNQVQPHNNQSPSKAPCYYQGLPGGGPLEGVAVVPQGEADIGSLSQPYLSYSEQSQIKSRPIIGNGGFPFPSLPNGNTSYSENK